MSRRLVTARSLVRLLAGSLPENNPGQTVHTRVPLFTKQSVTLCGWEGNYRSGVALAMRHGLSGPSTYELNDHRKGVEHPAYALCGVWH